MIKLTTFKSKFDNKCASVERTWEHIIAKLSKFVVTSDKAKAPLISPAIYADNLEGFKKIKEFKNNKGKVFYEWEDKNGQCRVTDSDGRILRANKNVTGITMLVFDFDSGAAKPEHITKPWEGCNYILHSTWSHTKDKGKFRLIVPLKNVLRPDDFQFIWGDVSSIAGDVDGSCKDPARMFYWPSCKPGHEENNIFLSFATGKFFNPKIKRPAKKKIKRGDYTTLDAVKWFSSHGNYIGTGNKAEQHWVKCPWEGEHQSKTEDVDAVLWESNGENWPTFSCSHNTCKKNERNIVQVTNVWDDANEFCARALTKESVKTKTNVKCLGHDDNGYYYYQSTKNNHVVKLKPEAHKELNFYDITTDSDYWYKFWGKEENGRIDWKQAARSMMEKCQKQGFFKPLSVRGTGCWMDDERVVVHLGDKLKVGEEFIQLTEFKSDYIYESAVQSIGWVEPLTNNQSFKFAQGIINRLPIPNKIEKFLLSGHCVSSILSGCLRWRPHVWITGDAGSGKTTILNDVLNKLWAPVGGVFLEGRTTESGVRQKIKQNSVPIIIDEVEANSKEEAVRVDSIIAMARSSSSNSSGNVAKGTISGSGQSFLVKACFTLSSVAEALQWGQDKERFLVVSVIGDEKSKDNWHELREMIETTLTKPFARAFYSRAVSLAAIIRKNCDVFHRAILKKYKKATSRNADQISVHAACAWSLRSDKILTEEEAGQILDQQGNADDWSRFWSSAETNVALSCLDKLLSKHLRGDMGRHYTVGELIGKVKDPDPMGMDNGKAENVALQRYGMVVSDDFLWISRTNQEFRDLFKNDGGSVQAYNYLRNVKGIENKIQTFLGIQSYAIGIPLDVIFRKR